MAGLALCALAGVAWWWLSGGISPRESVTLSTRASTDAAPFVPSQQGTTPDGALDPDKPLARGDEASNLRYGEVRRLFDYYLSAFGEQDLPAITLQIQNQIDLRLSAPQAKTARRLLTSYLAFKRALVDLDAKPALAGNAVDAIRQRMLAQQDLRRQYFSSSEIEGMFGFEDAYDADAVARLEISQNPNLKPEDKQKQLTALDGAMSPSLRAERDASVVVARVEQRASEMRSKGASDDEVYRMRAKEFDPAAASRLAELDQEEAAWRRRIANYLEDRAQLYKALANANPAERLKALTELQQRLFTEDERRRLVAYEPTA